MKLAHQSTLVTFLHLIAILFYLRHPSYSSQWSLERQLLTTESSNVNYALSVWHLQYLKIHCNLHLKWQMSQLPRLHYLESHYKFQEDRLKRHPFS